MRGTRRRSRRPGRAASPTRRSETLCGSAGRRRASSCKAAGKAVDAPTLTEGLRRTAANHPDIVAVRWPDDSGSLTWSELVGRVDAVAGGLAKLGVGRGDAVAIMLANRPEFHISDLAVV